MLHAQIITVRKNKEKWLIQAMKEYEKRLISEVTIEWKFVKSEEHLIPATASLRYFCLDSQGRMMDSVQLSHLLFNFAEKFGPKITFIIGGKEGIPEAIKNNAYKILSFSPLTFTHQMVRLILLEQIYRAVQIEKGTHYHQ
ncbi:MAG: 23S rRNA (pseudouridine(1915)-N(3))-methyltransferase RlmH [Parachlamydiales bacterium]|nr:23S rRNA (pseudouridine(1915)-N(3))-methyltransferase RlmH [Parachlamydiales bacterium]